MIDENLETEVALLDALQSLILHVQAIARGHQCKRPLPGADAQCIAKAALAEIGLSWATETPFRVRPNSPEYVASVRNAASAVISRARRSYYQPATIPPLTADAIERVRGVLQITSECHD